MRGPGSARRSSSLRASTSRCASGAGAPPPARRSLHREVFARLSGFGPGVAGAGQLNEMAEVELRLLLVAGLGGGLARTPIAAESLRIADLRRLVFDECVRRAAALQQHVAEQFARRDQPAGADRMLLALVLDIGGAAHRRQRRIALSLGEGVPGLDTEALHLDLGRPVIVLGGLQRLADLAQLFEILLRGRRVAAARRAE